MVTARLDCQTSKTVSWFVLSLGWGSDVVEVIEAGSVTGVPWGDVGKVATVSGNRSEPGANDAFVQVIVPVAPGASGVQDHPAGVTSETNVELVGTSKVRTVVDAGSGPSLFAVTVKVKLVPAIGVPERSERASCRERV